MSYAELYCQSHFSFLQSAASPEHLVQTAAALGYQALAITDECSVAGVVRAYRTIKEQQLSLQLIVGTVLQVSSELRVILLSPDRIAYAELCRIITNCRRRASKGHYQTELWDLQSCRHNLLIWLPTGREAVDQHWGEWLSKYHSGRLWLGQQRLLQADDLKWQQYCEVLSRTFKLPRTAVGAVNMSTASEQPLRDTMTAIRLHSTVATAGFALSQNQEACLRPLHKLQRLFSTELLAESCLIAKRCQFDLGQLRYEYPAELVPAGKTAMQHLRDIVAAGCQLRFGDNTPDDIAQQIEKELTLIEELHYPYYFLTIANITDFARSQHILYQGRGSAANSIVCYCLQITAVDPRKISVLFERFISRERDEPPDIDVDFEHERREEIIQYIYRTYGRERAALAATVICYRLRSALRDVGKALGFDLTQIEFWLSRINRRHPTLSWWQQLGEQGLDLQSHQAKLLIQLVEALRGKPRHLSQHVGGFIISAGPLYELVPVENAAMPERSVIQWDKDDLETLGLLKVDILALGMLSALKKALALVNNEREEPITLASISQTGDDPAVYQMISRADTIGVFQIESRAQMSMLPRLKPHCFYDLVIEIAIVRPGPIQGDMVHPYLQRRDGLEAISYPSPEVADVLSRTLGVPIFQEQVIKLAMVAAGFTGGEADKLRRAMASWKKNGELNQFRETLINGMQQRGYSLRFAEQIFSQICGFGEYGFPESHSASFALLAYASAWLKHYYPLQFLTALLNSLPMGFYSPAQLIADGQRHQLTILPPCIQSSEWDHQLESQPQGLALRLGLRLIKGLSQSRCEAMLKIRPTGGFATLSQLKQSPLHRQDLQALASADALKTLSGHRFQSRWQLLDTLDDLPLFQQASTHLTSTHFTAPPVPAQSSNPLIATADASLPQSDSRAFGELPARSAQSTLPVQSKLSNAQQLCLTLQTASSDTELSLPAPTNWQQLQEDFCSMGVSLELHPLALLRPQLARYRLTLSNQLTALRDGIVLRVAGLVTVRQSPGTASGVTFVTIEDEYGPMNLIVWQATALAQQQDFLCSRLLLVHGQLQHANGVCHIIAGRLESLDPLLPELLSSSRDFH